MISRALILIGTVALLTGCAATSPDYASCSSMKSIIDSYEGSTKMLIEDMNAKSALSSISLTDVFNMATTLKGTALAISMISGSDTFNELRDSLASSILNFGNAYESVSNGADGNSIDFQNLFDQTTEAATALNDYCRQGTSLGWFLPLKSAFCVLSLVPDSLNLVLRQGKNMTVSIHDVLKELRAIAYDERDKGTRFELLMQAYLKTEPQYANLYSNVWTWSEYPDRGTRTDTGIDLVAKDASTGELTAIQCKFYASFAPISKGDIDSFLAASSKKEFSARLIISTNDNWGRNAEEAVEGQNPPVQRLRVQDLDDSSIDWSKFKLAEPSELIQKEHKSPYPHQQEAISNVIRGFEESDRGKLIMACGTGKTFTSLQIAEQITPRGGTVLFLVPSISLLSQTLKEWTIEANIPLRSFAVCSDVSVGKRNTEEDIPITDLAYPATTNTQKLVDKFKSIPTDSAGMTVVFSTYQSIDVVAKAQSEGIPEFDLIICDEAHRTTGVTLAGDEESAFVRVHNQNYIKGSKRLYMTATPRIFAEASKTKAEEAGALLTDMNNLDFYGPEFHRLGFGEAVSIGRLTDYKVLILAVDETYISNRFQKLLADEDNSLALEDAAKIVGCWNGLSKRSLSAADFEADPEPMKRAVAFARNIKESKKLAEMFEQVVDAELQHQEDGEELLSCEVHHVDGTFNVLDRNKELDWLKEDTEQSKARILTNARCLSEGVDVPALDAVMFLNPRDSVVDVVQSVGRVMRKLEGKKYGYVILPIAVPTDVPADVALSDNKKYKVVWQVLQALRAHDERFDAMVNKIDLTKSTENKVSIIGVTGHPEGDSEGTEQSKFGQVALDFPNLQEYKDAILSRIVDKVGERGYWETWARDIAQIANDHIVRLKTLVNSSNPTLHAEFERFLKGLQANINPFITENDAIEMLSQHLITKPVFDALFDRYPFSERNPVSIVMQRMVDSLEGQNLQSETSKLERFYDSVRLRASGITDVGARQHIVKELYEKFFRTAFAGTSDRLGIVYTPNEIVDFIIHSVEDILKSDFDTSISNKGVHVLDPFTGTGTFIVRLLQSGLIEQDALLSKFRNELHANEIVLLAYYVAAINIEETFHSITNGQYEPFDGIVLTDTFQMHEDDDELDSQGVFPDNNQRAEAQKKQPINVIIGNPPYSAGQSSENENNKNLSYKFLDKRIEETYAAESAGTLLRFLYDSYIRALRWASDRIGQDGIIAFVTNGGFLDSTSADGLRKSLVNEFSDLYIFNLRGNARTSGEQRRKEKDNVFGQGSRTTVVISILVRNSKTNSTGNVHYFDIGDYLSKEQKLEIIANYGSVSKIDWELLQPNTQGDWINQRSEGFEKFFPLSSKQQSIDVTQVFKEYSNGVVTARDAWAYNFSRSTLEINVKKSIEAYNNEVEKLKLNPGLEVNLDPTKFSWDVSTLRDVKSGKLMAFDPDLIVESLYRPFSKSYLYFDSRLIARTGSNLRFFPNSQDDNIGIVVSGAGNTGDFATLMTKLVPCLDLVQKGQVFPRYTFVENNPNDLLASLNEDTVSGFTRVDNITDEFWAICNSISTSELSKDDVFFYIYGLLHHPTYRSLYESDLKKMMARIPLVKEINLVSDYGKALSDLHTDYESLDPYPLQILGNATEDVVVTQMKYKKIDGQVDKTSIMVTPSLEISNIPLRAHDYKLGSRSAIDWVLERYQVKTDKDSNLVNDPNLWGREHGKPDYIVELIGKVVRLSISTLDLIEQLPPFEVVYEQ